MFTVTSDARVGPWLPRGVYVIGIFPAVSAVVWEEHSSFLVSVVVMSWTWAVRFLEVDNCPGSDLCVVFFL